MPEGHSVHRVARQFRDVFGGARLAVSSPQGKFAAGATRIDGHVLETAEPHGKQMFLYFSHDLVMRVHLGLYGAWDFGGDATFAGASSIGAPRRIGEQEVAADTGWGGASVAPPSSLRDREGRGEYTGPPEPKGAVRVRLVSAHGWADLRGPTACEAITPAEAVAARNKLGPDPLHNLPGDAAEFVRRIRKSRTSIALQLMNQDVLAGVGNVYRAEVLFRLGLDPMLSGNQLQAAEAQALWDDTARIMADGVRDGRIITTELRDRPSGRGVDVGQEATGAALPSRPNKDVPADDAHYVYKRAGLPCRHCGTDIAMQELGGRKLYWCPKCQGF
ncbi:Fpg/Nei family DNA glycosylase [Arthrobacter sp. TMN-49]